LVSEIVAFRLKVGHGGWHSQIAGKILASAELLGILGLKLTEEIHALRVLLLSRWEGKSVDQGLEVRWDSESGDKVASILAGRSKLSTKLSSTLSQSGVLQLEGIDLLLKTNRNTLEVGEVRHSWDVLVRLKKLGNLIGKTRSLVLASSQSLKIHADVSLSFILRLEISSLILAFRELTLEGSSLGRGEIAITELVLEIGSLHNLIFKLVLEDQAELHVLRISFSWGQSVGNSLDDVINDRSTGKLGETECVNS